MEEDIFDNELGRKILALTKASFRVADLISDHVVREKIKHQVLNVYKIFFDRKNSELLKELDVLDNLFFLAGHLNLAKDEHVKMLRNGFLVFKSHIVLTVHQQPKQIAEIEMNDFVNHSEGGGLTERQEKILRKFPDKSVSMKLADFVAMFPGLSKRTVRNDLSYLIRNGKILREGQGSGTFYKLVE